MSLADRACDRATGRLEAATFGSRMEAVSLRPRKPQNHSRASNANEAGETMYRLNMCPDGGADCAEPQRKAGPRENDKKELTISF